MVDVLLDALWLERVLEDELHKNRCADGSCLLLDIRDHHLFYRQHQIVEVGAEELAINDGFEALEDVRLGREVGHVAFDDEDQGFDLSLGQVSVDGVRLDQLCNTAEECIEEFVVVGLCIVEQLEDPVEELLEESFEGWETKMNNVDKNVQSCHNDRSVKRLERSQEKQYERIQLVLQLLLHSNC